MRWYVEVSRVGGDVAAAQKLCVEAKQWQAALQEARRLKGESGPLSRFSIELLDNGYRAVDPAARLRYVVNRAPQDAALSDEAEVRKNSPSTAPPDKGSVRPQSFPPRPSPSQPPPGGNGASQSSGALAAVSAASKASSPIKIPDDAVPPPAGDAGKSEKAKPSPAEPVAAADPKKPDAAKAEPTKAEPAKAEPAKAEPAEGEKASLPEFEIVRQRSEERSEASPITYREIAYSVAPGTLKASVEILLWMQFNDVAAKLDEKPAGKFVQLAVFDHKFEGKPERPPIATLAWKDWRGNPVVKFRKKGSDEAPPSSVTTPSDEPAMSAAARKLSSEAAPAQTEPTKAEPAKAEPAKAKKSKAEKKADKKKKKKTDAKMAEHQPARRRGEDLILELFEAMHELHFMPDVVAGCDFVLNVLGANIPCEGIIVQVFDIDSRDFIVVRAHGPSHADVLMHRTPDEDAFMRKSMRASRARHYEGDLPSHFSEGAWKKLGVTATSSMIGPAVQGGRYLGVVELANPAGDTPFSDSEANAVEYICEQFAEFLANRPIVVDAESVLPS